MESVQGTKELSDSDLELFSLGDLENDNLSLCSFKNEITTQKPRKLQKYYRKPPFRAAFIPSIRILKRDIRRKYLDIFNNVVNSHNDQLFSSFVDDFYRPDAFMAHSFPKNAPPCFGSVEIQGLDLLKRMQTMSNLILPDSVMHMSNAQICKRLNEQGSRIIGNYHVQATAIYLPKVHKGREVDSSGAILEYDMDPHEYSGLERAEDLMHHVQIAKRPMELCFSGMYEMILDESHRIVRIGIFCQDLKVSDISLVME